MLCGADMKEFSTECDDHPEFVLTSIRLSHHLLFVPYTMHLPSKDNLQNALLNKRLTSIDLRSLV